MTPGQRSWTMANLDGVKLDGVRLDGVKLDGVKLDSNRLDDIRPDCIILDGRSVKLDGVKLDDKRAGNPTPRIRRAPQVYDESEDRTRSQTRPLTRVRRRDVPMVDHSKRPVITDHGRRPPHNRPHTADRRTINGRDHR
jgi:hypothetical protein